MPGWRFTGKAKSGSASRCTRPPADRLRNSFPACPVSEPPPRLHTQNLVEASQSRGLKRSPSRRHREGTLDVLQQEQVPPGRNEIRCSEYRARSPYTERGKQSSNSGRRQNEWSRRTQPAATETAVVHLTLRCYGSCSMCHSLRRPELQLEPWRTVSACPPPAGARLRPPPPTRSQRQRSQSKKAVSGTGGCCRSKAFQSDLPVEIERPEGALAMWSEAPSRSMRSSSRPRSARPRASTRPLQLEDATGVRVGAIR